MGNEMRLLIVDDNAQVRGLIKRALAQLGHEFEECATAPKPLPPTRPNGPISF
jgi:CheY-like chemotaxis protein